MTEIQPAFLRKASMRNDAAARLLLLLAKPELNAAEAGKARALAAQVSDWAELTGLAARKFVAVYVYRHLRASAGGIVPEAALQQLKHKAHLSVRAALRVVGVQAAFHDACIASTGARHAYIKGPALAVQSAQEIGERYCRDVDVLVDPKHFRAVLNAAVAHGYKVHFESEQFERANDIAFLGAYGDVVTLVGGDGTPIEMHRRLDKRSVNFDIDAALASAETIVLAGRPMRTLSKPLHFNYLCYHHSRHFWSKLHWLADLHALINAPDLDRAATLTLADAIGIRPTIEAAFEFCALTSGTELWGEEIPLQSRGGQFLGACLFNLAGELELEQSLRKGMPFGDFMSAWQVSSASQTRFKLNRWLNRLQPTPRQYMRWRLPPHLYWLYYARNALTVARIGLIGAAPNPDGAASLGGAGPEA